MTPHKQTYFYAGKEPGVTRGNCWQTCIASVMDLPLEEVPHFVDIDEQGGEDWWNHTIQWLWDRGWALYSYENGFPEGDDYVLVTGKSPRGDFYHVAVYQRGELVHDPHPDGTGLLTEEHWTVIKPNGD